MASARGFKKLLKQTIVKVNADCLNHVVLTTKSGDTFFIDAEVELNLPVVYLDKVKKPKTKPKKIKPKVKK